MVRSFFEEIKEANVSGVSGCLAKVDENRERTFRIRGPAEGHVFEKRGLTQTWIAKDDEPRILRIIDHVRHRLSDRLRVLFLPSLKFIFV